MLIGSMPVQARNAFRSDLLLTRISPAPRYSDLSKLDRVVVLNYTVGPSEELWSICKKFHFDFFTVRSSNDLEMSYVAPGALLRIPNKRGTLYEVKAPETLSAISQGFSRGRAMGEAYERQILEANQFPAPDLSVKDYPFPKGTLLFLPEAWKPTGPALPFLDTHYRLTSRFGRRHHPVLGTTRRHSGFDMAKPFGSSVITAAPGTVTYAGWMGGYGNMIEVRHVRKSGTVYFTRYGHLSKILVHEGQRVRLYQLIGRVGSTGISTGPHLHFEVRDANGVARNPGNYL